MTAPFDTLALARKYEAAGFNHAQAADMAAALADTLMTDLATKQDLDVVRVSLEGNIEGLRRDVKELEQRVDANLEKLEQSLIIKLGAFMVVGIGIMLGAMRLMLTP